MYSPKIRSSPLEDKINKQHCYKTLIAAQLITKVLKWEPRGP